MTAPDDPRPDEDQRDPRLAALLAVEPLDELTRQRMVARALRATQRSRVPSRRALAVAASIVLVVAAVGGIMARPTGDDNPVALRTPSPATGRSAAPEQADASTAASRAGGSREAATFGSGARDLGDYGDLGNPDNQTRLRRAADAAKARASDAGGESKATASTRELGPQLSAANQCARVSEPVLAVATGTFGARRAVVVVTANAVVAVITDPCELRTLD